MLFSEFTRLGIDPAKTVSQPPAGEDNAVFDLTAQLVFEGEDPTSIWIYWTERCIGDYDQNGEVGISDLTPLGQFLNQSITYDAPGDHGGIACWPAGDPDGDGAVNWRRCRIDGDGNGELNINDITPIAVHWREHITGYCVYRQLPGEAELTMVPNAENPELPYTIARSDFPPADANSPVRLYHVTDVTTEGVYRFYVCAYDDVAEATGPNSNTVTLPDGAVPDAMLVADPHEGPEPLVVHFDASGSTCSDGDIIQYDWDFHSDGFWNESGPGSAVDYTYHGFGDVTCTVRVMSENYITDTASITIHLYQPPVAVIGSTAIDGNAPMTFNLNSNDSSDPDGEIVEWAWDLDGNGSFETVSDTQLGYSRTLDYPQEITYRLRVTDNHGLTGTDELTVTAGYGDWTIQTLNVTNGYASSVCMRSVQGYPAIMAYNTDNQGVAYMRATDQLGLAWGGRIIVTDFMPGIEGTHSGMAMVRGKPAIAFNNPTDSELCFIQAEDLYGATWPDSAVTVHAIDAFNISVADVMGRPAIKYQQGDKNNRYFRATNDGGTAWPVLPQDIDGTDYGWSSDLMVIDGKPAIAFTDESNDPLVLKYADSVDSWGNAWNAPVQVHHHVTGYDSGTYPVLYPVDGNPAITFGYGSLSGDYSACFIRAETPQGDVGDWNFPGWEDLTPGVNESTMWMSLTTIDGIPHVAYQDLNTHTLWHVWAMDEHGTEWMDPVLIDDGGGTNQVGARVSIIGANHHPAVAYLDETAFKLKYAVLYTEE